MEDRKIRLRPETMKKLEAMAATMGLAIDTLANQLIEDSFPSPHHEDLVEWSRQYMGEWAPLEQEQDKKCSGG